MFCKTVVLTIFDQSREVSCSFSKMLEKISKRYLCVGGPRYPSVNTGKLGKTLKNMSNFLGKNMKKSVFSKMKLAGLLMKERISFPSKICPVF